MSVSAAPSSEFSRMVDLRAIKGAPVILEASVTERAALARRFDIAALDSMTAKITVSKEGALVFATGTLHASLVQTCVVTAEDFAGEIDEKIDLRFEPAPDTPDTVSADEEIELTEQDFDTDYYTGTKIDLGEALAQSLAVAIDPYPRGPNADTAEAQAKLAKPEDNSPFAALKDLKRTL